MPFQVSPLFNENLHFPEGKRVKVNQGGTSSTKTFSVLQVLAYIAVNRPKSEISVVSQDIPHLKKGAILDMEKIVASSPAIASEVLQYNKTDRKYRFKNGSWIEFSSYVTEQAARGGRRDYLFINEANGIDPLVYFQLAVRTRKKIWIDYNPTAKFWVHEQLIGNPEVELLISDHRDNPFLSEEEHNKIENIEDEELWKVYARGLTGQIKGLIYPNFKIIESFPLAARPVYGLDFGFNHKTALIEVGKQSNRLIWNELIYQSELTIGDLIQLMKPLNLGKRPIYCDHAAADKIEDLKRAGFNAIKADKDVSNGIDFVKRNQLYITRNSVGLRKEILSYKWNQKLIDKGQKELPVKFNDDGMDAGRYGSYSHFRKDRGIKVSKLNREWDNTQPSSQNLLDML